MGEKLTCLKCGTDLDLMNTDSRQEWVDEYYICPMCDTQWIHRTHKKLDSSTRR